MAMGGCIRSKVGYSYDLLLRLRAISGVQKPVEIRPMSDFTAHLCDKPA